MKLAMAQMSMTGSMDENLKRSLAFCDAAAGSDLLFFPEVQLIVQELDLAEARLWREQKRRTSGSGGRSAICKKNDPASEVRRRDRFLFIFRALVAGLALTLMPVLDGGHRAAADAGHAVRARAVPVRAALNDVDAVDRAAQRALAAADARIRDRERPGLDKPPIKDRVHRPGLEPVEPGRPSAPGTARRAARRQCPHRWSAAPPR